MHFLPILLALLPSLTLVTAIPIITMPTNKPSVDAYCHAAAYHQAEANKLLQPQDPQNPNEVVAPSPEALGLASGHLNRVDQHLEAAVKVAGDQSTVGTDESRYDTSHPHAMDYYSNLGGEHAKHAGHHAVLAEKAHQLYKQQQGRDENDIASHMKNYVWNRALSEKHAHYAVQNNERALLSGPFTNHHVL
jgi:hypothetical protein